MKSIWYILGAVCGAALVAAIAWLGFRLAERNGRCAPGKYDERQIAEQGRAYKAGFFTLIAYCIVYGITVSVVGWVWCEHFVGMVIGVCLAISVWAVICVRHDAYLKSSDSPRSIARIFTLIGIGNIIVGVRHMIGGDFVENGLLGINAMNFIVGVMFLPIVIAIVIKRREDGREAE